MKKNWFSCLIPQKNRLEKCSLEVKSVFENIDFWGTYGLRSIEKWPKSPKLLKMPIFRCFLVHKFPKNKYFQKPISLLNYIFQGGSFEVSNMKIYFFFIFFHQRVPPLVFENFDRKWEIDHKCQEKNKNRSEISGQNSFICPLWRCSSMPMAKNSHSRNHPNVYIFC